MWRGVNRIIVKNARGHAMFELGEPMRDDPSHVVCVPLDSLTPNEKADFDRVELPSSWPEVGSRMMTRLLSGHDLIGGWVVVQAGIYRYSVDWGDGVMVRSVLCEYLAAEVRWDS